MTQDTTSTENGEWPPLSHIMPAMVLGCGAFNYQINADADRLPVREIIKASFDLGFRAFDTSPYYGPSEELLGDALSQPDIVRDYRREDYLVMTKVGRISAQEFDYSPSWIDQSVRRSLARLKCSYLDVVFCHDIEFVPEEEALAALEVLLRFRAQGLVRYVGASGYRLDRLLSLSKAARAVNGRPLDIVQCWAQLTLQNTRLLSADEGLQALRDAGVNCVCNSSPLALGLLRSKGVPCGSLGDFHPAPAGLRRVAQEASQWVESQDENLASLAFRFSLSQALLASFDDFRVSTITGVSSVRELEQNVAAARQVFGAQRYSAPKRPENASEFAFGPPQTEQLQRDQPLWDGVQQIFGQWLDYSFEIPDRGWWESRRG